MTDRYKIKKISAFDLKYNPELVKFIQKVAEHLYDIYGKKFNWKNFDIVRYVTEHRFMVCYRDEVPVGAMMYRLIHSIFDSETKILYQDSIFSLPGTRAARLLMLEFLDFGKSNADHVISTIGDKTNIKRQSLEKLGFKELETLYRRET